MPNIDDLVDPVVDFIASKRSVTVWVTCLDLRYTYGQLALSTHTGSQCNFNILGGLATGTYQFATGFYRLTDMPAEFQQDIDQTLAGLSFDHTFIDDILICTKGTAAGHLTTVDRVVSRLDRACGR